MVVFKWLKNVLEILVASNALKSHMMAFLVKETRDCL